MVRDSEIYLKEWSVEKNVWDFSRWNIFFQMEWVILTYSTIEERSIQPGSIGKKMLRLFYREQVMSTRRDDTVF